MVGRKKPKPKPKVVKPHRVLSAEIELHEIRKSIYIERCCINKYRDDGDELKFAEKKAAIQQKMAQLTVALKQLEDDHAQWQDRVEASEKRIHKLQSREKILVNRSKLEQLARLQEQANEIQKELREKGLA